MAGDSHDSRSAVKLAFELIADDWNRLREKPWPVLLNFLERENNLKYFHEDLLLDLGCGNGRHSIFFAGHSTQVVGIDFSLNLLKIAKEKSKSHNVDNVSFILADVNALPFKKNIFTNIIYLSTLHHIPTIEKRQKNLAQIKQILKKRGICLISVWRKWQKRFFWHFFKQIFKSSSSQELGDIKIPWKKQNGVIVQRFYHLFSHRELKKLVQKVQLQTVLRKNFGGPTHQDNIFIILRKLDE